MINTTLRIIYTTDDRGRLEQMERELTKILGKHGYTPSPLLPAEIGIEADKPFSIRDLRFDNMAESNKDAKESLQTYGDDVASVGGNEGEGGENGSEI